jgi:hypothetical protein
MLAARAARTHAAHAARGAARRTRPGRTCDRLRRNATHVALLQRLLLRRSARIVRVWLLGRMRASAALPSRAAALLSRARRACADAAAVCALLACCAGGVLRAAIQRKWARERTRWVRALSSVRAQ